MKKILLLVVILSIQKILVGQTVKLEIIDEQQNPIHFASVYDSTNNIYLKSDENGWILLPTKEKYTLTIDMIGYNSEWLSLGTLNVDTTITVMLSSRIQSLTPVTITSTKYSKKRYSYGDYNSKKSSTNSIRGNIKVGYAVTGINSEHTKILKKIKFKIESPRQQRSHSMYNIELKLYQINDKNKIDSIPLNTQPIIVNSEDFRRKNEVAISESILIPKNGLFISLEFPQYPEGDIPFKLNLVGTHSGYRCNSYTMNGSKAFWNTNILNENKECKELCKVLSTFIDKPCYPSLCISIEYDEYITK